jgi:hypothetical protein
LDDLLAARKLGSFLFIDFIVFSRIACLSEREKGEILKAFIGARGGTGYSNNTSIQGPIEPSFGDDSLQEALPAERMLRQLLNTETLKHPLSQSHFLMLLIL